MRIVSYFYLFFFQMLAFAQVQAADTVNVKHIRDSSGMSVVNDLTAAQQQLQQLLQQPGTTTSSAAIAECYLRLGVLHYRKGDLWKALRSYNQSDSAYSLLKDLNQRAIVHSNRSAIYIEIEQFDLALKDLLSAAEIVKKGNDSLNIARKQVNLGNLYLKMKLLDQALAEYEHVLGIFKRHGSIENQANVLENIGGIMVYQGNHDRAYHLFQQGLKIRQKSASYRGLLYSNSHLGFLFENQNFLDSALYRYGRSYYWATLLEDQRSKAKALGNLAVINHMKQEYDSSIAYSEKQVSLLSKLNDSTGLKEAYRRLAETYREKGSLPEALNAMVSYDNLQRSFGTKVRGQLLRKARMQHKLAMMSQTLKLSEQEAKLKELTFRQKQTWAIALTAILLGILVAVAAFYRVSQNQLKVKAVVLEQQLLRSKSNPHFIFNVFNSIQSYFLNNRKSEGQHYLRKFAQLMRVYFEFTELKEISLKEELREVALYVEVEKMRLETPLSYRVEVVGDIDLDNILIPPFLLHTYVENSIWHGFVETKDTAKITLKIEMKPRSLLITLSDNGIGINESQRRKTGESTHNSEGLKLNKRRLIGLGKRNRATVKMLDFSDTSTRQKGTEVQIQIPV